MTKKYKLSDFGIVSTKSALELAFETIANPDSTESEKRQARIVIMKNDNREISGKKEPSKVYND